MRQQEMFEIFLDLEVKRKNDAFALICIKEYMDDNIFPLISDAKTTKEAWDTLERSFGVRGRIEVEDEGGSIAADVHWDEKLVEYHYARLQVDEYLVNLATKLANENLVILATKLADEILVNPET